MILEVRCCCHADRLLGYLAADLPDGTPGKVVHFTIPGHAHPNGVAWSVSAREDRPAVTVVPARQVPLTLGLVQDHHGRRLALKSDETPLETLREVPGWREAAAEDLAQCLELEALADRRTDWRRWRRDAC